MEAPIEVRMLSMVDIFECSETADTPQFCLQAIDHQKSRGTGMFVPLIGREPKDPTRNPKQQQQQHIKKLPSGRRAHSMKTIGVYMPLRTPGQVSPCPTYHMYAHGAPATPLGPNTATELGPRCRSSDQSSYSHSSMGDARLPDGCAAGAQPTCAGMAHAGPAGQLTRHPQSLLHQQVTDSTGPRSTTDQHMPPPGLQVPQHTRVPAAMQLEVHPRAPVLDTTPQQQLLLPFGSDYRIWGPIDQQRHTVPGSIPAQQGQVAFVTVPMPQDKGSSWQSSTSRTPSETGAHMIPSCCAGSSTVQCSPSGNSLFLLPHVSTQQQQSPPVAGPSGIMPLSACSRSLLLPSLQGTVSAAGKDGSTWLGSTDRQPIQQLSQVAVPSSTNSSVRRLPAYIMLQG